VLFRMLGGREAGEADVTSHGGKKGPWDVECAGRERW
jgi:hypothetical protein